MTLAMVFKVTLLLYTAPLKTLQLLYETFFRNDYFWRYL